MSTVHRSNREKLKAESMQLPEWLVNMLDWEVSRCGPCG